MTCGCCPAAVAGAVDFRIDKRDSDLQHSNMQCFWSPDGSMVAAAKANKIKVWALQDPETRKETLTVWRGWADRLLSRSCTD